MHWNLNLYNTKSSRGINIFHKLKCLHALCNMFSHLLQKIPLMLAY